MTIQRPRVMIVDDHELVRDAVRSALVRGDIDVVGTAATVTEAEQLALDVRPDVILMDVNLPDGSGIHLVRRLASRLPSTECVMLTVSDAPEDVHEAVRNGAVGYLTKDVSSESLVRAIRGVVAGELAIPRRMARDLVRNLALSAPAANAARDDGMEQLSERERAILALVANGRTTREIADAFVLSPRTVEGHVASVLRKLGVRNRAEAAARYRARGR
jgi:DNA-binding NarL/FixJ family response regulator